MKLFKVKECRLALTQKWGTGALVTYPVSYIYNGGIHIDGVYYKGFKVAKPSVPSGYELVSIGCGLQLNAHPPYATSYLRPLDGKNRKMSEMRRIIVSKAEED